MGKLVTFILLVITSSFTSYAQQKDSSFSMMKTEKPEHVYKIKPWIDIPVTLAVDIAAAYTIRLIDNKDTTPLTKILALKKSDLNSFDRSVANNYSSQAKSTSDYFFYGSMPLPLFLLLDKKIRKDGLRVEMLYLQALGTTGVLYTASAALADRLRPLTYNPDAPIDERRSGNSRNSFFAGHPALVATSTFFMAKVYADYHPNMKHKWLLYAAAGSLAFTTGYLRIRAGYHFYTDVITGVTVGALVGVLVPQLHKNKLLKNSKLTLLPKYQKGNTGFTAFYQLGS